MKTKITLILPLTLILLFCNVTFAGITNAKPAVLAIHTFDVDTLGYVSKPALLPQNNEESYINDIPFNTWNISAAVILAPSVAEEEYINDIPFETETIAARFLPIEKLGINQEPDSYVNDIPFDTHKIACEYLNPDSGKYCLKTL